MKLFEETQYTHLQKTKTGAKVLNFFQFSVCDLCLFLIGYDIQFA